MHSWRKYARNSGNKTFHAWSCRFSSSRCSLKTRRLICRTASNPSLPRFAFWLNLSILASSTLFLIFCHPPQSAVILASWLKSVEEEGTDRDGLYTTVSRTLRTLDHVRLVEHIVSFFETGSTYDTSYTWEVASPPKSERTHLGTDWLQVIRRSVRSYIVANRISHISHTLNIPKERLNWNEIGEDSQPQWTNPLISIMYPLLRHASTCHSIDSTCANSQSKPHPRSNRKYKTKRRPSCWRGRLFKMRTLILDWRRRSLLKWIVMRRRAGWVGYPGLVYRVVLMGDERSFIKEP